MYSYACSCIYGLGLCIYDDIFLKWWYLLFIYIYIDKVLETASRRYRHRSKRGIADFSASFYILYFCTGPNLRCTRCSRSWRAPRTAVRRFLLAFFRWESNPLGPSTRRSLFQWQITPSEEEETRNPENNANLNQTLYCLHYHIWNSFLDD